MENSANNCNNFISVDDVVADLDEESLTHQKNNNIEFMPYQNANEVVNEIFESLLLRHQIGSETLMIWNSFIFD